MVVDDVCRHVEKRCAWSVYRVNKRSLLSGLGDLSRFSGDLLPEEIGKWAISPLLKSEHTFNVPGTMAHDERCFLGYQHDAVRLDRSGNMDGFLIAAR